MISHWLHGISVFVGFLFIFAMLIVCVLSGMVVFDIALIYMENEQSFS